MDSELFEGVFTDVALPLPSLRLLVPPLQLMTASMWQVVKQRDVMNYWTVAEFVSLVMEMIPDLLMYKYRTQLNLGLRARYILELCRNEQLVDPEFISSHLDRIKSLTPTPGDVNEIKVEGAGANFIELVQTLLKDPDEREHFLMEVFSAEYGPQYDADLQTLFWEFLCRLAQLLPIPDLEQTVSWLGNAPSVLEDCVHSVSEPTDLKSLLQHHKRLGHLEKHVPPSPMGDCILSSLSVVPHSRAAMSAKQPGCDSQLEALQALNDDTNAISFVDEVEVEVVTVTDYTEVELGTSSDADVVVVEGNCYEGTAVEAASEDPVKTLSEEPVETLREERTRGAEMNNDAEEEEVRQERCERGLVALVHPGEAKDNQGTSPHRPSPGPHDCPDCDKSFKFASSLIAHRVIHTGERPHRCNVCGRCFSFRQSLDRHKHTHKSGQRFDCEICRETFRSSSACTEHKRQHMEDGVFACTQCDSKFTWELALAKHLKTHADGRAGVDLDEPSEGLKDEREVGVIEEKAEEAVGACPESVSPPPEVGGDSCNRDSKVGVGQVNQHLSAEPRVLAPKLLDEVISLVQVRTSGRKRKPAMKIQVMNLQKSIVKVSAPRKRQRGTTVTPPDIKPVSFNSAEHSYGSPLVSSKEDDGSVADGSSHTFSCPQCSFSHIDEAQVQQHVTRAHSGEAKDDTSPAQPLADQDSRFGCPDCEKSFKFQSLLKAHQRIHTGERPYVCSQCGRCFSFKQSLERHKHTHKDGRKYECLICGEFFKSLAAHREHKSTHMENGEYLCSKCGRAFAWKSALVRHLKTHGEDADKTEHPFKCSHCDLSFSCVTYLNRHLLTHKEERLHVCMCGKSFAYKAALTAHQRTHQKERPHQCKQCGKGFLYKGGLQSHMKIHSEDMPFMCSFCGKSFKRERNMKKHEHCHTRENVFSCSQCEKSFVYKATLIRHELTHSGERPFLCSDCGKGFFSHAELLKHERFHTGHKPFQCSHCGKRFTQSCYLTIHLRYHTGVRPYSCTECDKSFLSANRLKRHQRTHTGEKPYLCVECGKGFKQSYHLKMHQRTHNT